MFSWLFPASCPVDEPTRLWIEWRTSWLIDRFGKTRLFGGKMLTPDSPELDVDYQGDWESVERLFEAVANRMGVDARKIELFSFTSGRQRPRGDVHLQDVAGVFDMNEDGAMFIGVSEDILHSPEWCVATLAHELAHALLLGDGLLEESEEDHEPLTDLLAALLGCGVFLANSEVYFEQSTAGHMTYWSWRRQGYFVYPAYGYALALWVSLVEDGDLRWLRYVRPDVRSAFKQARRWMRKQERGLGALPLDDTQGVEHVPMPEVFKPGGMTPKELTSEGEVKETPCECGARCGSCSETERHEQDPLADPQTPDDYFTRGVMSMIHGENEHAFADFDKAIELGGEDFDFFSHRADTLNRLGRHDEALADIEHAIAFAPDEIGLYVLRGCIHFARKEYEHAREDLEWVVSQIVEQPSIASLLTMTDPIGSYWVESAYWLGRTLSALGDHDRAIAILTDIVNRMSPPIPELLEARAEAYEKLGEFEKANHDRQWAAKLREE